MSAPDDLPTDVDDGAPLLLDPVRAPEALLRSVERRGVHVLAGSGRSPYPRSLRVLVVDVGMASFSVVYLVWCARTIGLLP
ncbi:MAG: hypothetical protein U0169_04185 [Polyangiaceae bacterium]